MMVAVQSQPARISTLMQIILVICVSLSGCVTSSSFVSTPASENGVLTTCVGEQISFTCSHAGTENSNTGWKFSPPTDCSLSIDHENSQFSTQCDPFTIQDISNTTQGLFTSTAVTTANASLSGTVVECADGIANANQIGSNVSICVVAPPTNLNVDGSRLSWSGTSCSGTTITYEVTVSGPQTMRVFNVTSRTFSTPLGDLAPNTYRVAVRAFSSSCSTQAAVTTFVASGNGGPTTTSSTSSNATSASPRPSGDSGAAIGLGITIPLLLVIIAVAAVAAIFVYYFMFYKPNRKPSANLIQDPTSPDHKYEEIKPERKFLSRFKFKKKSEPPAAAPSHAPSPPPPRQGNDTLKVPLEGSSVDPPNDKGKESTSVDKKETVINIGGHKYHELDDLDEPKSPKDTDVTKKGTEETVINIGGHSYHELDALDKPKSQEGKEDSSAKQKVINVGGHSYQDLDGLEEPSSHKGQDKPGTDSAKPSAKNSELEPDAFDPERTYSEIDKMKKEKDRRKKAAESAKQDPDAPPLPPAYSPTPDDTGGNPPPGSTEEGTKEPSSAAQEPPQKPPRTKTNSLSMSQRPEKPKRASKDLQTTNLQQSVSASDKEQLNQTSEQNGSSPGPPQKPPRSNTNTAPEKPKRASKIDNSEQRSPSPKPSNT